MCLIHSYASPTQPHYLAVVRAAAGTRSGLFNQVAVTCKCAKILSCHREALGSHWAMAPPFCTLDHMPWMKIVQVMNYELPFEHLLIT